MQVPWPAMAALICCLRGLMIAEIGQSAVTQKEKGARTNLNQSMRDDQIAAGTE
jgi:hypothetical protein